LYLKKGLMILGTVKTTCRWGTGRSRCRLSQMLQASRRLAWQDGQKCLVLQEKVTRYSRAQSGQRILAKPHLGLAQLR